MVTSGPLAIRRELIEYGIPFASWLGQFDSPSAIANIVKQLVDAGDSEGNRSLVRVPILARVLEISLQHAQTLVDVIEAVAEDYQGVCRRYDNAMFCCTLEIGTSTKATFPVGYFTRTEDPDTFWELYQRQAARPDTMDVWPGSDGPSNSGLNSSSCSSSIVNSVAVPMDTAPSFSRAGFTSNSPRSSSPHASGTVYFQQQRSNHLVLKELQGHLLQHQQALRGYCEYVERHALTLLHLVENRPEVSPENDVMQQAGLTTSEFDRLSLLFRPAAEGQADRDGSPMDVTPTPFTALAEWLANNVVDEQPLAGVHPSICVQGNKTTLLKRSAQLYSQHNQVQVQDKADKTRRGGGSDFPSHGSGCWKNLGKLGEVMASSPMKGITGAISLPPAGVVQSGSMEVQGVCKSTVVRGEDDFASGILRVTDCHDSIVYALAPLQYASVTCCSDCTVVLGQSPYEGVCVVSAKDFCAGSWVREQMLRVEKCERLQLIAACVRICISSCHDCIFYLGLVFTPPVPSNHPELAPYNTQYERLPIHLSIAGVTPEPNLWDKPVTLAREHGRATPDSGTDIGGGTTTSKARDPVQLLPPERLVPFMVPFQGGRGPMCVVTSESPVVKIVKTESPTVNGESPVVTSGWAVGLTLRMGRQQGGLLAGPGPFRLPQAYEEAKDKKVAAVAELRNAVKSAYQGGSSPEVGEEPKAVLDDGKKKELQSVIQSYFKEWLVQSGNMRQNLPQEFAQVLHRIRHKKASPPLMENPPHCLSFGSVHDMSSPRIIPRYWHRGAAYQWDLQRGRIYVAFWHKFLLFRVGMVPIVVHFGLKLDLAGVPNIPRHACIVEQYFAYPAAFSKPFPYFHTDRLPASPGPPPLSSYEYCALYSPGPGGPNSPAPDLRTPVRHFRRGKDGMNCDHGKDASVYLMPRGIGDVAWKDASVYLMPCGWRRALERSLKVAGSTTSCIYHVWCTITTSCYCSVGRTSRISVCEDSLCGQVQGSAWGHSTGGAPRLIYKGQSGSPTKKYGLARPQIKRADAIWHTGTFPGKTSSYPNKIASFSADSRPCLDTVAAPEGKQLDSELLLGPRLRPPFYCTALRSSPCKLSLDIGPALPLQLRIKGGNKEFLKGFRSSRLVYTCAIWKNPQTLPDVHTHSQ
eukprot:jgi/Botrbrau1/12688/Bobra.67_1s0052.1